MSRLSRLRCVGEQVSGASKLVRLRKGYPQAIHASISAWPSRRRKGLTLQSAKLICVLGEG